MSWFKKVKEKCVDTYSHKKGLKFGYSERIFTEDDMLQKIEEYINYPRQLNPSICSCFILSHNKERRNAVIDKAISPYKINAQQSCYSSDDEKDKKGNILVFEMPNAGGIIKAEELVVKSLSINEVDGSHKYLTMTIKHAISLQHTFKALVVKNVENILEINRCADRYQIMATLVNIQNEFGRPTIFTGSPKGLLGVAMTEQHEMRFLRNTFVFSDEIKTVSEFEIK